MRQDLKFSNPFSKEGKPKMYLTIIACLLDGTPKSKREILTYLGKDVAKVSTGYFSDYFASLNGLNILEYTKGKWYQGSKYQEYLIQVFKEMLNNDVMRKQFKHLLIDYDENTLDFIMHNK